MDHQILTRRQDLVLVNKKKRINQIVDFVILEDYSENKRK